MGIRDLYYRYRNNIRKIIESKSFELIWIGRDGMWLADELAPESRRGFRDIAKIRRSTSYKHEFVAIFSLKITFRAKNCKKIHNPSSRHEKILNTSCVYSGLREARWALKHKGLTGQVAKATIEVDGLKQKAYILLWIAREYATCEVRLRHDGES